MVITTKLSTNEILILNALQAKNKPMDRLDLISITGISDKNISAKIKSLEVKGLIITQKTRVGRSTKQIVQLTSAGKKEKLVKIIIEKKIPKKEDVISRLEKAKKEKVKEVITPKKPEKITPKPLPETLELKKELRLLINLVLTHRKEEYKKYGYKSVSEIRASIDALIDQLGG